MCAVYIYMLCVVYIYMLCVVYIYMLCVAYIYMLCVVYIYMLCVVIGHARYAHGTHIATYDVTLDRIHGSVQSAPFICGP